MTPNEPLLVLGLGVLTLALRSVAAPTAQRLAIVGTLATTCTLIHLLTGSWITGIIGASVWFFLPWIDILTRVRRMRLPVSRTLAPMPPPSPRDFPTLSTLTEEVEDQGFEHVQDAGWEWQDFRQFFRLFYHAEKRALAAICLSRQDQIDFYYLSVSSREPGGKIWVTWNYPFSAPMKLPPQVRLNRQRNHPDFPGIYRSHLRFLQINRVQPPQLEDQDEDRIRARLQEDLARQVAHNIDLGLLTRVGDDQVRYSTRGMFFLWTQLLLDLLRWR